MYMHEACIRYVNFVRDSLTKILCNYFVLSRTQFNFSKKIRITFCLPIYIFLLEKKLRFLCYFRFEDKWNPLVTPLTCRTFQTSNLFFLLFSDWRRMGSSVTPLTWRTLVYYQHNCVCISTVIYLRIHWSVLPFVPWSCISPVAKTHTWRGSSLPTRRWLPYLCSSWQKLSSQSVSSILCMGNY